MNQKYNTVFEISIFQTAKKIGLVVCVNLISIYGHQLSRPQAIKGQVSLFVPEIKRAKKEAACFTFSCHINEKPGVEMMGDSLEIIKNNGNIWHLSPRM